MKKIYIESLAAARKKMKELVHVKSAILFLNLSERPIAAWIPNGYSSGQFVTRSDIKKNKYVNLNHNFNGGQGAFHILKAWG